MRTPLFHVLPYFDTLFAFLSERYATRSVAANGQGLAPAGETVVIPERDLTCRRHRDVHTVTVGDLVQFLLWLQLFMRDICEQCLRPGRGKIAASGAFLPSEKIPSRQ